MLSFPIFTFNNDINSEIFVVFNQAQITSRSWLEKNNGDDDDDDNDDSHARDGTVQWLSPRAPEPMFKPIYKLYDLGQVKQTLCFYSKSVKIGVIVPML